MQGEMNPLGKRKYVLGNVPSYGKGSRKASVLPRGYRGRGVRVAKHGPGASRFKGGGPPHASRKSSSEVISTKHGEDTMTKRKGYTKGGGLYKRGRPEKRS